MEQEAREFEDWEMLQITDKGLLASASDEKSSGLDVLIGGSERVIKSDYFSLGSEGQYEKKAVEEDQEQVWFGSDDSSVIVPHLEPGSEVEAKGDLGFRGIETADGSLGVSGSDLGEKGSVAMNLGEFEGKDELGHGVDVKNVVGFEGIEKIVDERDNPIEFWLDSGSKDGSARVFDGKTELGHGADAKREDSECIGIESKNSGELILDSGGVELVSEKFEVSLLSTTPLRWAPLLVSSRSFSLPSNKTHLSNLGHAPSLRQFVLGAVAPPESIQDSPVSASEDPSRGRIYHETYGCQMNVNDMEIVLSIMKKAGYSEVVEAPESAEIIFINTCAIRDNAEQKVWQRLNYFWFLKRHWKSNVSLGRSQSKHPPKVVVLGCMAERLKDKILDADKMVDVVCGPDAYRDLPRLLEDVDYGQKGINTLLSLEETYADISPVRIASNSVTAFVSIMRGCNNMCSFCIVPFTRGRERSRPVESIVREVGELWKEGVKEIMLLGQNVNSYNDASGVDKDVEPGANWRFSEGFSSKCKVKNMGLRFSDLLDQLSAKFPEMRFRYTSPHPKDFPDELLYLMRDRYNICKSIHLPAQSGSTTVLERMRRGHTREAYLDLVKKIRYVIPNVGISSDFICGFCGETEEEHADTLSLVGAVGYDMAYMFAYSMREKTHAHRNYLDDVPDNVKQRRLTELIDAFRESTGQCFDAQIGTIQLVLVEGPNKRAPETELIGKSDRGHRVAFLNTPIPNREGLHSAGENEERNPKIGDFVEVHILKSSRASLSGESLAITSLSRFHKEPDVAIVAAHGS